MVVGVSFCVHFLPVSFAIFPATCPTKENARNCQLGEYGFASGKGNPFPMQ